MSVHVCVCSNMEGVVIDEPGQHLQIYWAERWRG